MQKVSKVTYHMNIEEIKAALTASLEIEKGKQVDVSFEIREVGGDPMDRFPGTPTVVGASVSVSDKKEPTGGIYNR